MIRSLVVILLSLLVLSPSLAQESVARKWNEVLLEAIRNDFARPTVHARNLFHTSTAIYDAWATYHPEASTYFMGNRIGGYVCDWGQLGPVADMKASQEEAISYAAYRLLIHRFQNSPGADESLQRFDSLMTALGYDINYTSTDFANGPPAAAGNYIAQCLIQFGLQDGSNEAESYANLHYEPVNPPLLPFNSGNPMIEDLNRWQPLTLDEFIDQGGNPIPFNTPDFLGPEWGLVTPFALTAGELAKYSRESGEYWVYNDPGPPPQLNTEAEDEDSDHYKWGFELVSIWSSHLDPSDGVMWDISPASIGNIGQLPTDFNQYQSFYDLIDGGDNSTGYDLNPVTGQPYTPQLVPRGDYARVLAEFWADGPDSETPPGHWFVILNHVNDHPLLEKRFKGQGEVLDDLEWDVKAYFTLAGAMHDAAVTAWGIKGWYDYIRPISAIRGMADLGQSSDPNLSNYHLGGIRLVPGYIEMVGQGDPLAGADDEHVGKIKLNSWKGPDYIDDPEIDEAGVGWILAEDWWPYQRPTFVTPPFAGYISGHSTFSRAAAEVLTQLTGSPFFPGGLGEFEIKMNEFLVFEKGPSVDMVLQWATYHDASDQTSLSRIWGGIHPPADDIPGRRIGEQLGNNAFTKAEKYFEGFVTGIDEEVDPAFILKAYPNPLKADDILKVQLPALAVKSNLQLQNLAGQKIWEQALEAGPQQLLEVQLQNVAQGFYILKLNNTNSMAVQKVLFTKP